MLHTLLLLHQSQSMKALIRRFLEKSKLGQSTKMVRVFVHCQKLQFQRPLIFGVLEVPAGHSWNRQLQGACNVRWIQGLLSGSVGIHVLHTIAEAWIVLVKTEATCLVLYLESCSLHGCFELSTFPPLHTQMNVIYVFNKRIENIEMKHKVTYQVADDQAVFERTGATALVETSAPWQGSTKLKSRSLSWSTALPRFWSLLRFHQSFLILCTDTGLLEQIGLLVFLTKKLMLCFVMPSCHRSDGG